ncbi:MAG: DUF2804 domain-containing protein [Leptospiraceae bacterium]|nr:DUF2804 domain-containing protein [Leptospiraceae bacterium]
MEELPSIQSIKGTLDKNFGRYKGLLSNPDTSPFEGSGIFSNRRLTRKAWVFSGIITEEYIIGFAIVDAGYIGTAFCYLWDRKNQVYLEEKSDRFFGFPESFNPSLSSDWSLEDGAKKWSFRKKDNQYIVSFIGKKINLEYSLTETENGVSVIAPSKDRPFHFTYKNMNLKANVKLNMNGENINFEGYFGTIDFSKGFPPRETFWNWASLSGVTEDGKSFALNLVTIFNDGLENILWLDEKIIPLGKAKFHYNQPISKNNTSVTTEDEIIEFNFFPEGERSENLNVLVLKSNFTQAFGKFEGKVNLKNKILKIKGFGLLEEHTAVW